MNRAYRDRLRVASGFLALVLLVISNAAMADVDPYYDAWEKETMRQCPSNHIDWASDADYLNMIGNFENTLSRATRKQANRLEDYRRVCRKETMGFYCEMGAALIAYTKLGLVEKFAAFTCRHYRCVDYAMCDATGIKQYD